MDKSAIPHLIIINSLIWLASFKFPELPFYLAVHKRGLGLEWWQILTYFFTHQKFWHIFGNMLALWSLGTAVEAVMGTRHFLKMYLFTGIASGLILAFLDPSPMPVLGASTSVSGVLTAFAYYFPRSHLILFPVPIPISARTLAIGFGLLSLALFVWEPVMGGISHLGHLSGLVLGWVYLRWLR
ncbi:MAG: rhomboid family intramembrane serine protease [Bacteroidia bacterium]|nr:rhomboid family intramembrane serine protease [Bacteroidia bacterium]MDW8235314.1 rhomboid family intramembrane serine protease [Bacteroidia bacterium]